MQGLSFTQKYFGSFAMDAARAAFAKRAYTFLLLSLVVATATVILSVRTGIAEALSGVWFLMWILLLGSGFIAARVAHKPGINVAMLALNGIMAGLALSLTIYRFESYGLGGYSNAIIALGITGLIFAGTTLYVFVSKKDFRPLYGLMWGMFFGILGVILISFLIPGMSILAIIIAIAVGILGVMGILGGTSELLHSEDMSDGSAIGAALVLFTGIFNLFISIFQLLGILGSSD